MESTPPQKPETTITQPSHDNSNTQNTSKTVNRTLETTLSQKQHQNLKKNVETLKKRVLDLTKLSIKHHKDIKSLNENIESLNENIKLQDEDFTEFDGRCLKIEYLCKSHTQQIKDLQSGLTSDSDSTNEELLELKKELRKDQSELKKEQAENHALFLLHMGSYANTEEKVNTQEQSLQSLKKTTLEYSTLHSTLLGNVIEGINKSESSNKQDISRITQEISELKNNQLNLQNIITHQTQSISTLRKLLMFFGGGSGLVLTIWLWHHTHK